MDYYDILQVDYNATKEELLAAYQTMAAVRKTAQWQVILFCFLARHFRCLSIVFQSKCPADRRMRFFSYHQKEFHMLFLFCLLFRLSHLCIPLLSPPHPDIF